MPLNMHMLRSLLSVHGAHHHSGGGESGQKVSFLVSWKVLQGLSQSTVHESVGAHGA